MLPSPNCVQAQILHSSKPMSGLCKKEYKTIADYNNRHQDNIQTKITVRSQETTTHDFVLPRN
jgi:hypothetical protein